MKFTWLENRLENRFVHHGLRFGFATLVAVLLIPFKLDVLDFTAYDWRAQLSPRPAPSGQVVLLAIEQDTLRQLKRDPEALDWVEVLKKLTSAEPLAVVSLINPTQIQGSLDELNQLAQVAKRLPFQFGDNTLPTPSVAKLDPLPSPFESIPVEPLPKTADRQVLARDGVTRRLILTYDDQFTLHPRLAARFNHKERPKDYAGVFELLDSDQMFIRFRSKGAYPTIKFGDALLKPINPASVRGKIVLIGRDTRELANDYVTTPLNKGMLALSQLEMHANILDTLILNQAPRLAPDWLKTLLTFLIALLTIYVVLSVRPGKGLLILSLAVAIFLTSATLLFALVGWVMPVAHPLLAVFICYYFVIPYRLIIENRRSWEYFEKNRLLTQVEELKSNFMRMMSHDLKTPLARISGMADMILKEPVSLNETQRRALDTISESAEELTNFIGSILSLSRIESKELKLQLRSRDVNELVEDVVRRTSYLAHQKKVDVATELEPLFSVKVDAELLKTVLLNLIENAIKYSGAGTRILITTEEIDNQLVIQVSDQGRGIPPDDLAHVFDRFYRASNSRSNSPGNGLGLYLARYFVELHHGQLEVESVVDKGSTFTVRLPIDVNQSFESADFPGGVHV